jgi:hypothetical protein
MMEKVATINRELTTTEVVQFFNKSQSHKHEHRHCIKPKGGKCSYFTLMMTFVKVHIYN